MSQKGISRRDFIKGSAASLAGLGLLGSFGSTALAATDSVSAAAQNTGASNWLGAEPQIAESDITRTEETDVLVLGGGTGGLFAAASALEAGLKTTLLEKNAMLGSVKDDLGAFNSRLQQESGTVLGKEEVIQTYLMYSGHFVDQRLVRVWAEESGAAIDWYEDLIKKTNSGYLFHEGGYDQMQPTNYKKFATGHSPKWNEGMTGAKMLEAYINSLGGQILMETAFVKFEHEGKKVTAVIAKQGNTYIRFKASKGIVLSTGGYQQNLAMLNALQPHTVKYLTGLMDGATCGDGIKACLWMGAAMDVTHCSLTFDRGAIKPDELPSNDVRASNFTPGSQPFLKVNLKGERFANESTPYDFIMHSATTQPGNCYTMIFDSGYYDDVVRFDTVGCSRWGMYPNGGYANSPLENLVPLVDRLLESGHIQKADSIEELARKLNIPEGTFAATVNRYNELYDKQYDEDFFKEAFRLSEIRKPPYYGVRLCGRMLNTLDGIRIDTYMRPLDENSDPFEGLHIIGDASGSYFSSTYPNLFTGFACGRTLTYARRVARVLSGELK